MSPVSAAPSPSDFVPDDKDPRRLVKVAVFRGRDVPIFACRDTSLDEAARLTVRASNLHCSHPPVVSPVA